jgi:polyhydroxyalkanoate synthesis repressor PhaR
MAPLGHRSMILNALQQFSESSAMLRAREVPTDRNDVAMSDNNGSGQQAPVTIKKYANRRLYNTATSSYVTLDHLSQMVKEGTDFVVYDAKTGADITRSVLTQIIVEEESKGQNLLPVSFLRQIISFYGDNLESLIPQYLEFSMKVFAHNQEEMRKYVEGVQSTFGLFPLGPLEEMAKRNMAMFEQAMNLFTPFHRGEDESEDPPEVASGGNSPSNRDPSLAELEDKLAQLQRQFAALAKKKGG